MGNFSRGVGLAQVSFPASKPKIIFTTLPPPDPSQEADRGLVVIQGGGATVIDLNHQFSKTVKVAVLKEIERTVDRVRIKNPAKPAQHVDVERPKEVRLGPSGTNRVAGPANTPQIIKYAPQPKADNIEILEEDITIKNPEYAPGSEGTTGFDDGGGGP